MIDGMEHKKLWNTIEVVIVVIAIAVMGYLAYLSLDNECSSLIGHHGHHHWFCRWFNE